MRSIRARFAAAAAALCSGLVLLAAPVSPPEARPPSAETAALRNEAFQYASALMQTTALIQQQYVRPVSQADLLEAALTGLYEAARQPLPAGLRQDLQRLAPALDMVPVTSVSPSLPQATPDPGGLINLLVRLREHLGSVDALRDRRDLLVSLKALPRALDPYCGVAAPKEFIRYADENQDRTGLDLANLPLAVPSRTTIALNAGADFAAPPDVRPGERPTGPLRVVGVTPGGPGQHAGLRPGDAIASINGQPVEALKPAALLRALGLTASPPIAIGGLDAAPVCRLTVRRPGRALPLDLTLVPAAFRAESVFGDARRPDGTWDFLADPRDQLGYLRVGAIDGHTHEQVQEALHALTGLGLRGLVLDLRWCPGGLLAPAAAVARLLLPGHVGADDGARPVIARTRKRNGDEEVVTEDEVETGYSDFSLVVLVNGDTSGGGELIAAALQDHGRAVIAGQRTVGKASVQSPLTQHGLNTPVPIPVFKITGGTFLRPSGKNLQRFADSKPSDDWGIRPDAGRELPVSVELGRQLKEWYQWQVLRPYDSREALPLDDPENDPQRQAAFQMLRGMRKQ